MSIPVSAGPLQSKSSICSESVLPKQMAWWQHALACWLLVQQAPPDQAGCSLSGCDSCSGDAMCSSAKTTLLGLRWRDRLCRELHACGFPLCSEFLQSFLTTTEFHHHLALIFKIYFRASEALFGWVQLSSEQLKPFVTVVQFSDSFLISIKLEISCNQF